MFDIQKFAESVCEQAYPASHPETEIGENKWKYHVQNLLGYTSEDLDKEGKITGIDPQTTIVVTWALAGIDNYTLDNKGDDGINFELIVNAPMIKALNAFHWSLMRKLRTTNGVRLSALLGDVEEDETVGRTIRTTGRAYRVWGLTVSEPIVGMNYLFEE